MLRRRGANIPVFMDAAAPALLVAQAIGRVDRIVPAEANSINESRPKASNATDPATRAETTATPASTVIHPMLSNESVLARRISRERVLPAGWRTGSVGACELISARYRLARAG